MEMVYGFLANSAEVVQDGRFFVQGGGIDGIGVRSVPSVMPSLAIVANISFEPQECEQSHRLRITLTNPDGNVMLPDCEVELRPRQSEPAIRNTISLSVSVNLFGLPLRSRVHIFLVSSSEITGSVVSVSGSLLPRTLLEFSDG